MLWLQDQSAKKAIRMAKVDGSKNLVDVQTKNVYRVLIEKHMQSIACNFRGGMIASPARLHTLRRQVKQMIHTL